ncbi:hypothetical protein Tco_1501816 [Tanacetum coccineum]
MSVRRSLPTEILQLPSYTCSYGALIADEMPMDKEVTTKVKWPQEKQDSDDGETMMMMEDPSAGSKPGFGQQREKIGLCHFRSNPESGHSEQSLDDIPMKDEGNDSDMEDTDNAHIPKVSTTTTVENWAKTYATTYKVPEEEKLQRRHMGYWVVIKWFCRQTGKKKLCKANLEVDFEYPRGSSNFEKYIWNHALGGPPVKIYGLEELVPSLWVESEREYDISAVYGITHWWFRRKEFYINKHSEPSDREAVRSQMRILSVISVKVFEKYGYNYLREIILRRADYQEYKISEKDFRNLHPNDFEDLFLLNIQEKLNHLPKTDKTSLHTAVNMWIRNLVIRNRVGDLQLGIESYQTKINLERPNWDAADYYFKEDYTIVPKPRAVVYRDRNDQRKLMRLNELHKFSDGTLTRVMEKLDQMVKDFHLYEYNKGMETRKWSEDDKRRSKDFITAIEKRLQIRRIYRSLESFVGGRIRDIDYRLINRTTYDMKRSKSEIRKVPTEIELVLEQTQQGSSHEVSVAVAPAFDFLEPKCTIESRAKRSNYHLKMDGVEPHKGVKASANSDVMYSFTSAQDGDPLQDDVRLCLGDDLKKAQDHSQRQA